MNITVRRIEEITPYDANPRRNDAAVDAVAASISEFGWKQPIVVDREGVIVAGHTRYKAAQKLGLSEVPVVIADDLTEEQVRAYRLADNKTAELAGWDDGMLSEELAALSEIDMSAFGFNLEAFDDGSVFFSREDRNDDSREEGNEEYNEFLEKFEPKKTTDDCYTPEGVYDAVADWVAEEYGLRRENFVRPFYPGGDYQRYTYGPEAVVVDNPPFSILAEILRFYTKKGIRFFLFAPTLTLFSGRELEICYLPIGGKVTYENGAIVNTSFITNLEKGIRIRTSANLYKKIEDANAESWRSSKNELPKYDYPPEVVTAAGLSRYSVHGVDFCVPSNECYRVSELDSMKSAGKAIFGGGFLLSEQSTKRNIEAKKKKDENIRKKEIERLEKAAKGEDVIVDGARSVIWSLSERERNIIRALGSVEK